jgi:LysM repeat protein
MNNPSPFVPEGSNPEQKNVNRQRVRFAVFCILSVHVAGLMALLLTNGCRRQEPEPIPAPDTNALSDTFDNQLDTPTNIDTTMPVMTGEIPPPPTETNTIPISEPPVVAPAGQEYTILAGDSFSKIAGKFPGVTVKQLQDANPTVQPTRLRIGQKIVIPAPSISPTTSGVTPLPGASAGETTYTVKSGDTLTGIASRHGTTVRALRSVNNLTTDKIRVGQRLTIPAKAPAPGTGFETAPATPTLNPPAQ